MPRPLTIPAIMQAAGHDCGDAAVRAVLAFHGRPARRGEYADPVNGLAPDAAEAVFRAAGFRLLAGAMTVTDLGHLAATGRPVLCPIQLDGCGHWVVVAGVSHGRVFVHDPLTGPRKLPLADWAAGWWDRDRHGTEYRCYGVCGWPG